MHFRSALSLLLAAALGLPFPIWSQQASDQPAKPAAGGKLKVTVVQGEGAINNIRARSATQPVVEVRDESDKPVAGAEVVFTLPAAGPGGVFNGWMRTQTARTNAEGQAGVSGFTPNEEAGRFNIKVTANHEGRTGGLVIGQSNALRGGAGGENGRSGWWKWVAAAGAAAVVGGVVAATRNGNDTPAALTPVTITPGPITVGTPR